MKNIYIKLLIISIIGLNMQSCKSIRKAYKEFKKENSERRDSTDELRDEQMEEHFNEMNQIYR